jgi:hypothetical protein
MMGDGPQARRRAERVGSRRRDTPATPGAAGGPTVSGQRRGGTASPGVGLTGARRAGQDGSAAQPGAWRPKPGGTEPRGGAGVHRRRPGGGLPHEAKAAGQARGYADVGTVVGPCSGCRARQRPGARLRARSGCPGRGRRQRAEHTPGRVPLTGGVPLRSRVRGQRSGTVLNQRRGE